MLVGVVITSRYLGTYYVKPYGKEVIISKDLIKVIRPSSFFLSPIISYFSDLLSRDHPVSLV